MIKFTCTQKAIHKYGFERLRWKDEKLYHQKKYMGELIPHEIYPNHYHLKFAWRDEATPEFFNIFNAKENLMRFALHRLNYDVWESHLPSPPDALNEEGATHAA